VFIVKYKKVKHRKRGFPRTNGQSRQCMARDCGKIATFSALRKHGLYLEAYYCEDHARVAGLV